MNLADDGSTSPTLLSQVADWDDHPAWVRFRDTYDHRLQCWCRGYGLDPDAIDEICQRIWIELATRMRTFEYDPSRTFRGWLRRLCGSRVLNFLHERRAHPLCSLDDRDDEHAEIDEGEGQRSSDPFQLFLLGECDKVQEAVRAKVQSRTWDAFWLVAVCDWSVARTGKTLGMTVSAVYAARERVARMLREEGQRVSEHWPSVS